MPTRWDEFELKQKMLLEEYGVLALQWRFLQGARIAVFVAVATAQATLSATYRIFLVSVAAGTARTFDEIVLLSLAWAGLLLTYIASTIGQHLIDTILGTLRRGINLEDQCGITDGMFQHAVNIDFGEVWNVNLSTIMRLPLELLQWIWAALIGLALLTIFGVVS